MKLDVFDNPVFNDTFVTDDKLTEEEWEEMGKSWVESEENSDVMESVVDDELEAIDKDEVEELDGDEDFTVDKILVERKLPTRVEVTEAIDIL